MNGRTGVTVLSMFLALSLALASEEPAAKPPDPPALASGGGGWRYGDDFSRFSKPPKALEETCGKCHATPAPNVIVRGEWMRILREMGRKMDAAGTPPASTSLQEIADWYLNNAPADFDRLPNAANPGALEFRKAAVGSQKRATAMVTNVNIADVDGDGKPEILVCDGSLNSVSIVRADGKGWKEEVVASCEFPVHTAVLDADADGDADIAVSVLGGMAEDDKLTGAVLLLVNNGAEGWGKRELAKGLPRVTDAEPADVDGDGDPDLVIGAFGAFKTGGLGWLRNDGAAWEFVKIADRPGAIHVPVADFNGDGRPDFAALVAQEAESVTIYVNKGGSFEAKTVFEARNPLFGSSGLRLADLDKDGDTDMLFTNGDAMSDSCLMPWPYHGVQWLENRGNLDFEWHDIGRTYGAFSAVATDLDGDGDNDVAVAVLFGWWEGKGESGLIWYENDGKMKFTCHTVPGPIRLGTIAAGDLDGDGVPELATGQLAFGSPNVDGNELLLWSVAKKK